MAASKAPKERRRKFSLSAQRIMDVACHYLRDKHFPEHHIEAQGKFIGSGNRLSGLEMLVTNVEPTRPHKSGGKGKGRRRG